MQELPTLDEKINFIRDYQFHPIMIERFTNETNKKFNIFLTDNDVKIIIDSLKDFFISIKVNNSAHMPSRIVDELWHTFLLYTQIYADFCQCLGEFIHHAPDDLTEASKRPDIIESFNNKRKNNFFKTYQTCCSIENLEPYTTPVLPRLFLMDSLYQFEDRILFCADSLKKEYKEWLFTQ